MPHKIYLFGHAEAFYDIVTKLTLYFNIKYQNYRP